jgi:hypothetical protein
MVATPKINGSKFSPVASLGKSPQMNKKIPKYSSFKNLDLNEDNSKSKTILSKFGGGDKTNIRDSLKIDGNMETNIFFESEEIEKEKEIETKAINVNRKTRNVFKNLETIEHFSEQKNQDIDLPLTECVNTLNSINLNKDTIVTKKSNDFDDEHEKNVQYEGFLIKISTGKTLLKRWFKLIHRDFYCNN